MTMVAREWWSDHDIYLLVRLIVAAVISVGLSMHGLKKQSLDRSGCLAAFVVGFVSLATSYRNGLLLLLFYYSSSKLTKLKEDIKASLEEDYMQGGQRNWIQVLANSVLSTAIAILYYALIGEDRAIDFSGSRSLSNSTFVASQLACMYIAHFATANGDTWASEVGILAPGQPRLVTSLFLRKVPAGTNGGMSLRGTLASVLGGGFIGSIHWAMSALLSDSNPVPQFPLIAFGCVCGFLGSLLDSLLGATLQSSYYDKDSKKIVKQLTPQRLACGSVQHICGVDVLSNEAVNFFSIALTMALSWWLAPWFFCVCSAQQCGQN